MEGVLDLPESGKITFDNVLTSPSADSQTPKQHKYDIAQLFDRLDSIQASLNNNTVSVSVLMNDMKDVKSSIKGTLELAADVSDLKTQNEYLSDRVDILEGRIASQSDQIKDLANAVEEITYRYMRDNLIINNLPEQGQGTEDCDTLVYDFIRNKLRVPNDQIFSRENPHAPVKIDVSHRFPRMGAQTKPMVVKFTMRSGRDVCLKFAKNLKGTGIYITDQLPKSMSQRKQAQMPKFKDLRPLGKTPTLTKTS
ncbi:unnamed protein product [Owenia fusiformis]|uniref:Uncharacterized protein n=1 Tax=Owenia fusiformis TaxID=6347 RepID=A0A8J1XK10_OWEFU|nr:unnamed protein product [Owenia fusiformis]